MGGVRYDDMGADVAGFEVARRQFADKLSCLTEQQPFVGHVNRQVIGALSGENRGFGRWALGVGLWAGRRLGWGWWL